VIDSQVTWTLENSATVYLHPEEFLSCYAKSFEEVVSIYCVSMTCQSLVLNTVVIKAHSHILLVANLEVTVEVSERDVANLRRVIILGRSPDTVGVIV
jgi:hypothetical protein